LNYVDFIGSPEGLVKLFETLLKPETVCGPLGYGLCPRGVEDGLEFDSQLDDIPAKDIQTVFKKLMAHATLAKGKN
jgi:hypothetical protein